MRILSSFSMLYQSKASFNSGNSAYQSKNPPFSTYLSSQKVARAYYSLEYTLFFNSSEAYQLDPLIKINFKSNHQTKTYSPHYSDTILFKPYLEWFDEIISYMFDSIATLFSTPIIARSYQPKPSLRQFCKRKEIKRFGRVNKALDKQSEDVIDSLSKPVETWIIQKEPHLKCAALNEAIFQIISNHSQQQNKVHSDNKTVLIHNLFVLIVQYKILNERIKVMSSNELEIMIDGLCGVYLLEEKGPFDQLTCLLHFIISSCKMHQCDNLKGNLSLFRALELRNIPNFFKTYSELPSTTKGDFIDIVVNIVPMMTELCKIVVKTDHSPAKIGLLERIEWLGKIGIVILNTIRRDIESVIAGRQQTDEQIVNPSLRKRLFDKGNQLVQSKNCFIIVQGIITRKVLFSFAYKQLYYFQHTLKLHKYMMQMASQSESFVSQQQRNNLNLVSILLRSVSSYEFNLPDTSIQSLSHILNVSLFSNNNQNDLYLPNLNHPHLQQFIEDLKCSPSHQLGFEPEDNDDEDQFQFYLEKDQSIISSILEMVFSLKLQYLELLKIIMEKTNKNYLENLQFYLIKNGLLHFLIVELQSIQSNDKKSLENYFKVLAILLHRNTIAYCILNNFIYRQIRQNEKSILVEYIRKNFVHSKELLFTIITDTISINSKKSTGKYFVPLPLKNLLYINQTPKSTKHDIWISYIHDVILRELKVKKEKDKSKRAIYDEDINEWVMMAIILQIQYMIFKKGSDIELGEFTMAYLTNMLKEAIKWKYEDQTSLMKKLLKTYQQWQLFYTQAILATQHNEDIIEKRWGPTVNFLFLRKWNKKICNSIKIFIESVATCKNDDLF